MSEQQEVVVKPESSPEMGEEQKLTISPEDTVDSMDSMENAATETTEGEEDQIALDDLGDIEFLLDEIEDQIAPLAL